MYRPYVKTYICLHTILTHTLKELVLEIINVTCIRLQFSICFGFNNQSRRQTSIQKFVNFFVIYTWNKEELRQQREDPVTVTQIFLIKVWDQCPFRYSELILLATSWWSQIPYANGFLIHYNFGYCNVVRYFQKLVPLLIFSDIFVNSFLLQSLSYVFIPHSYPHSHPYQITGKSHLSCFQSSLIVFC